MAKYCWNRIKNWLIHKLGGYTISDWWNTHYVKETCGHVETIRAKIDVQYPDMTPYERTEKRLQYMLLQAIMPYATIYRENHPGGDPQRISYIAEIKVVANNG